MVESEENKTCVVCRKITYHNKFFSIFQFLPFSKVTIANKILSVTSPFPLQLLGEVVCSKCYTLITNIERCEENLWIVTQELLHQIQCGLDPMLMNKTSTSTEMLIEDASSDSDESYMSSSSNESYGSLYRFDDVDTDMCDLESGIVPKFEVTLNNKEPIASSNSSASREISQCSKENFKNSSSSENFSRSDKLDTPRAALPFKKSTSFNQDPVRTTLHSKIIENLNQNPQSCNILQPLTNPVSLIDGIQKVPLVFKNVETDNKDVSIT